MTHGSAPSAGGDPALPDTLVAPPGKPVRPEGPALDRGTLIAVVAGQLGFFLAMLTPATVTLAWKLAISTPQARRAAWAWWSGWARLRIW